MIHEKAEVETKNIGENVVVWRWSHISKDVSIGNNVMIGEFVYIGSNVKIGNDVRIQNGAQIFDGAVIEDMVYIGPNVIFTNVRKPKITRKAETYLETIVHKGASIGANSTIVCGIEVGEGASVLPGCVVHKSIPPYVTVGGNPSRVLKQPRITL